MASRVLFLEPLRPPVGLKLKGGLHREEKDWKSIADYFPLLLPRCKGKTSLASQPYFSEWCTHARKYILRGRGRSGNCRQVFVSRRNVIILIYHVTSNHRAMTAYILSFCPR